MLAWIHHTTINEYLACGLTFGDKRCALYTSNKMNVVFAYKCKY